MPLVAGLLRFFALLYDNPNNREWPSFMGLG